MRYRGSVSLGCLFFIFFVTAFWGPYSSNLSSSASQSVSGRKKQVRFSTLSWIAEKLSSSNETGKKRFPTETHIHWLRTYSPIVGCNKLRSNQLLTRTSDLLEPLGRKLETETIVFNFSPVSLLLLLLLLSVAFRRSLTVASFHFFFRFCAKQQHFCSSGLEFLLLGSLFSEFWFGCLLRTSYLLLSGKQLLDAKSQTLLLLVLLLVMCLL